MLHAAAAQHGHPQEEAQHQEIQGAPRGLGSTSRLLSSAGGGAEAPHSLPLRSQVVPFSQRSGVLEWCSGTLPIGQFLVDPEHGAHQRFRPQDWTNMSCRKKMMVRLRLGRCPGRRRRRPSPLLGSPQAAIGFEEKLQAYSEVCRNFRPVFRFFCMERFLDPAVWMEKRLAYTRSVATSSIGTARWWQLRLAAEPPDLLLVLLSGLHRGSGGPTHPEHPDRRADCRAGPHRLR